MSLDRIAVLVGGLTAIVWVNWYFFLARRSSTTVTGTITGIQEIRVAVAGGYTPQVIRVKAGLPVRLLFERTETNPCSEEVVIADFGIRKFLPAGATTPVEFTPPAPGRFEITCGMGMLHGQVIAE